MSLLTPEQVPVKVYKWDDIGAPALNKTANCMINIFKACLVDGYGSKTSAGWTAPFEDAGVKVLRPAISPSTDFYLRLSADTGTEVVAQVYLDMNNANTGDLKLQCATPFKYAKKNSSGKWILVASPRGICFLCEQAYAAPLEKKGAFFYAGDVVSLDVSELNPVYLHHTGGTYTDGDYASIAGVHNNTPNAQTYVNGKLLINSTQVLSATITGLTDGTKAITTNNNVTPMLILSEMKLYKLSALFMPTSGAAYSNFASLNILGVGSVSVFGTGGKIDTNSYVATDYWVY